MNKAQNAAVAGGIQQHSVGGIYPYAVVGFANGSDVVWHLENLQEGTILVRSDTHLPLAWKSAEGPVKVGTMLSNGYKFMFCTAHFIPRHVAFAKPATTGVEVTPREAYYAAMEMEVDHV
jgi:hypothetical protein